MTPSLVIFIPSWMPHTQHLISSLWHDMKESRKDNEREGEVFRACHPVLLFFSHFLSNEWFTRHSWHLSLSLPFLAEKEDPFRRLYHFKHPDTHVICNTNRFRYFWSKYRSKQFQKWNICRFGLVVCNWKYSPEYCTPTRMVLLDILCRWNETYRTKYIHDSIHVNPRHATV